jgi:hypothetical protein
MQIASKGQARCTILVQNGATPAEQYAAEELAAALKQITGATIPISTQGVLSGSSAPTILIGPGGIASAHFSDIAFDKLGSEQVVMRTQEKLLLLAGGRPRGTLYAVYRFLQRQCGVRWWAPWAVHYPRKPDLSIGDLNVNEQPAFEARSAFWFPAFDGDWAARNFVNGESSRLEAKHGGKVIYKGFVHTFYPLVPPEQHFKDHPEWYSLIDGQRKVEGGQLCTTNPQLRDFVVERVRQWLQESPDADIVSISQNDWYGACQCENCKALDTQEGSHSGTMLALVNYVAERLADEFPKVAFDTLAYQYTRKAPATLKPRSNVIVRLCSIECNFAAPLTDASNAAFAKDIRDWSKRCQRLYIWDYVTNFAHYVQPHPNWFVLGPNARFFHKNGVKGLFEQGAYQSHGAEMAEMRAWVLAQLLWDPYQDDRALINEFLDGYYGKPSARYIREYLNLLHQAARGYYLGIGSPPSAPFLKFATLSRAERLWEQAEAAAKNNPETLWRVRVGRLPIRYVWLTQWAQLRRECLRQNAKWPLPTSRKAVADEWLAVATGPGPQGWTRMTHLNEPGLTPEQFVARFAEDPPEPVAVTPAKPIRPGAAFPPPTDIPLADARRGIDGQEEIARLFNEGVWAEVRPDPAASDGLAVWMPGDHRDWAFQLPVSQLPARARKGKWQVYAVIRVEKAPGANPQAAAFTTGVYDTGANTERASLNMTVGDASETYRSYRLGVVETNETQYIWVAPPADSAAVRAIWVDRVYLVPSE